MVQVSSSKAVVVALGAAATVVAVVLVFRAAGTGSPEPSVPPTGGSSVVSTEVPSVDPSYWTTERMRSAEPARMPADD